MKIKTVLFKSMMILTGILFVIPLNAQVQNRKGQQPDMTKRSKNSLNVTPMTSGVTAQQMVETILGAGVTYNNVQYTGANIASGLYSGGINAGINLDEGIILSSGAAENAIGPNDETDASTDNGMPGDADLDAMGYYTNDAAVLEFDFITQQDNISFSFVMGSEEYPEYINSYPDVFAFFLDGVNIAYVPNTAIPISIGTINHEQNSGYYISNSDPVVYDIQCDGFTVVFQLFATVIPNTTHHIKMAVADANDFALDTWIFLESGSFVGTNLPPVASGFPIVNPEINVGDTYNLTVEFSSPEPNQITEVVINPDTWPGLSYTITPGQTAVVDIEFVGSMGNLGGNTFEFVATDNGTPPLSTTKYLTIVVLSGTGFMNCMEPGWQLISSYIEPVNPELEVLMADLNAVDALIIMLNRNGFYWPSQNINLLGDWDSHSGYKVKMAEAGCIIFDGAEVMDKTVDLLTGVNYLPVLDDQPVPAIDIFSQIETEMLYAFDIVNGLVYWPEGGLYTLMTLEPGKGYLVSMIAPGTVTYPETDGSFNYVKPQQKVVENAPWTVDNTGIAHIVSIYSSALEDLKSGDIIAAFNSEGICVGMTQYNGANENLALVVYGDDFTTEVADGMIEGELMHFVVYKPSTEKEIQVQPVWDAAMPNSNKYADNGLSAITDFKAGALAIDDSALGNIKIFPNPSTGVYNITGIEEQVEMFVLNAQGQLLMKESIDNTKGTIQLNLSSAARGIYYIKLVSETGVRIEKIILE